MEFGWINLAGCLIVLLILIPNIVYAIKGQAIDQPSENRAMLIIEQIGRYGCIVLMWLPFPIWKFSFRSVAEMLLYLGGNIILVLFYYLCWAVFYKNKNKTLAMALAILPTCVFLLSGFLLRHWLLVITAILFGAGHIYITSKGKYSK